MGTPYWDGGIQSPIRPLVAPLLLDLRDRGWQAADAWLGRDRRQRSTSAGSGR